MIIFACPKKEGLTKKHISASLLVLTLAACSNFTQPTPTRTAAAALTNTPLPPTATPAVVSQLIPEGQPASSWMGIPIMPGAITGDGDEESYVFTIKSTPQQVQEYYQLELGNLGWEPFAEGDGDSSLMLIFMNNASATLTVSIIAKGDEALVLLVK